MLVVKYHQQLYLAGQGFLFLLSPTVSSDVVPVPATQQKSSNEELQLGGISVYYWAGKKAQMVLFRKIKNTVFIFTNSFNDLDILSMLAISHVE